MRRILCGIDAEHPRVREAVLVEPTLSAPGIDELGQIARISGGPGRPRVQIDLKEQLSEAVDA